MTDSTSQNDQPIDLVCPWVTFDPQLERDLLRYRSSFPAGTPIPHPARYREFGELRYSIESALKYMPWLNKIYIVTNGQKPPGLLLSLPKVEHCTHRDFFLDSDHLPTFSSSSIGINTPFIPGLSESYLLTNDDVFVGRPLSKPSVVGSGRGVHHFAHQDLESFADRQNLWRSRVDETEKVLQSRFGKKERKLFAHTPQFFTKSGMLAVWDRYSDRLSAVSSGRVPNHSHVLTRLLYLYETLYQQYGRLDFSDIAAMSGGEVRMVRKQDHCHVSLTKIGGAWERTLEEVKKYRPSFFCLNDNIPANDYAVVSSVVLDFLSRYYD